MTLAFVAVTGLAAAATAAAAAVVDVRAEAPNPGSTCERIAAQTDIEIWSPATIDYNHEQTEYWSTACGALKPRCILAPSTTDEMSAVVAALRETDGNRAGAARRLGIQRQLLYAKIERYGLGTSGVDLSSDTTGDVGNPDASSVLDPG